MVPSAGISTIDKQTDSLSFVFLYVRGLTEAAINRLARLTMAGRTLALGVAALWCAGGARAFVSGPPGSSLSVPRSSHTALHAKPAGAQEAATETREAGGCSNQRREAVGAALLSVLAGISLLPEAAYARGGVPRMAARVPHGLAPGAPMPRPLGTVSPYGGYHAVGAVRGRGSDEAGGHGDSPNRVKNDSKGAGADDSVSPRTRKDTCPIKGACAPKTQYTPPPV